LDSKHSIENGCILTGKVDLQTVLGMLLVIVGFSRAPVGVRKHRSITPQPPSILKREYKSVGRLQEEALVQI